jgi:hypothetical protein
MMLACRCCQQLRWLARGEPMPRRLDDYTCSECVVAEQARVDAILARRQSGQKAEGEP